MKTKPQRYAMRSLIKIYLPLWGVWRLLIASCLFFSPSGAAGQLNDAQFVVGCCPNSEMDFRNDTVRVTPTQKNLPLIGSTNAAISDDNGELLYYTNGVYIAGKQSGGDSILNGNGLSPCVYTSQSYNGLEIPQGALFLPQPGDFQNRYYYLIHFSIDNGVCYTLYHSLIDSWANFGLGAVISKNDTFYQGITRTGGMTACKHANGRDWWIVIPSRNNNLYRIFLLTPNGIADTLLQNIGPVYHGPTDQSSAKFSLDGTKYVISAWAGLITVMDFDRCTGLFSNPVTIYNNTSAEPINAPGSGATTEFSPNGRFIYATNSADLNQYDLWNSNIQDSIVLYRQSSLQYASTSYLSLAMTGKIYASTWAGGYSFVSVINYPDRLGLACNFVYGGQPTLSDNSINISNTANPRLGPLVGSGCDTITGLPSPYYDKGAAVRVTPNPADKAFYIEMPRQGNYVLELYNMQGQLVEQRKTKQVDIINVLGLDNGTYLLSVTDAASGKSCASKKVVVKHR